MRGPTAKSKELLREIEQLKVRLAEAEDTLSAIRRGAVDAVVVAGPAGDRVFTLESAERPYRLLIEQMQEGAVTLAPDGTILYCNQRFAGLVQAPLETVMGGAFRRFVAAADQSAFATLLADSQGQGEVTLRTADGGLIPVQLAANALIADGLSGICLVVTDLTQQRHNEEILAAERLARSVLENTTEAIVVCDVQGMIIRASRGARRLVDDNPLGRPFVAVYPLLTAPGAPVCGTDAVSAAIGGQILRGVEAALPGRAGEQRTVLVGAGPLYGAGEQIVGCVLSLTDISERKRAEEALQKLNETLEERVRQRTALISLLHDVASAANRAETFGEALQIAMRRACEEFGWCCGHALQPVARDSDELTLIEAFYAPSSRNYETFRVATQAGPLERGNSLPGRVLATGRAEWTTELHRHLEGSRADVAMELGFQTALAFPVLVGCEVVAVLEFFANRRIPPDDRALAAISGIGMQLGQILERQRAEARLRQSERLVSLGTFASGVAHEINNPLAAIQLTARHGLKIVRRNPAELETVLKEILEDTQRCTRIVAGVLKFARREPSPRKPVALAEVLHGAYTHAEIVARSLHVRVALRIPDNLPIVEANTTELEQVIVNLVANAAQASRPRQIVVIRAESLGDRAQIQVQDHGRGMNDETRARVFDPFFTTRASEGGTGLGLSMVHGIVTEHGGTILVESREGRGTRVTVELPCRKG